MSLLFFIVLGIIFMGEILNSRISLGQNGNQQNETVLRYPRKFKHSRFFGVTKRFGNKDSGVLLVQKRSPTMKHVIEYFGAFHIGHSDRKIKIPRGYDYALVKAGPDDYTEPNSNSDNSHNLQGEPKRRIAVFGVIFSSYRAPILQENPVGVGTRHIKSLSSELPVLRLED